MQSAAFDGQDVSTRNSEQIRSSAARVRAHLKTGNTELRYPAPARLLYSPAPEMSTMNAMSSDKMQPLKKPAGHKNV